MRLSPRLAAASRPELPAENHVRRAPGAEIDPVEEDLPAPPSVEGERRQIFDFCRQQRTRQIRAGQEMVVEAPAHSLAPNVGADGQLHELEVARTEPRATTLLVQEDRKSTRLNSSHANISY